MRVIALALTLAILTGCAAPMAEWRPLHGQSPAQSERDWAACQPRWGGQVALDGWDVLGALLLSPYYQTRDRHKGAICRCIERAGYEKRDGRCPAVPVEDPPPLVSEPDGGLHERAGDGR